MFFYFSVQYSISVTAAPGPTRPDIHHGRRCRSHSSDTTLIKLSYLLRMIVFHILTTITGSNQIIVLVRSGVGTRTSEVSESENTGSQVSAHLLDFFSEEIVM